MKRNWCLGVLVVAVVIAGAAISSYLSRPSTPPAPTPRPARQQPAPGSEYPSIEQMTRVNADAGVDVAVAFLNPTSREASTKDLVFYVALDTHEGDLSAYNVATHAVLTNDRGETITSGFSWKADLEGGHHRSGWLRVRNLTDSARPLWDTHTKVISLQLKNLARVPARRFEWRNTVE